MKKLQLRGGAGTRNRECLNNKEVGEVEFDELLSEKCPFPFLLLPLSAQLLPACADKASRSWIEE